MKKEKLIFPFGRIGLYYLVNIILVLFTSIFLNRSHLLDNFIMILIDLTMVIFVLTLLKKKFKGQLQDFKKNWKENLKTIFKFWLLGLLLMMITNLIINVFIMKGIAPNEETNREVLNNFRIYAITTMCLLTPIIEEALFRLNFKNALPNKKVFLIVTSLLFGLMHVILQIKSPLDILYLIPYSILGLTFGLIFYNTKNITSSIIAHMLHNTVTIIIVLLG